MFQNYLKIAWRNILKNKSTSFINVTGLAIGMAVAMMIGLWIRDELTFNTTHKNYDRLAQVCASLPFNDDINTGPAVCLPYADALRNHYSSDFKRVALASWTYDHVLAVDETKLKREGMHVEPAFAEMMSLDLLQGTYADILEKPNSIVLAKSLADALFGSVDPMGKTIRFNSESDMIVTGVFQDLPFNDEFHRVKFYVTWAYFLDQNPWALNNPDGWGNYSFQLFVEISEAADMAAVSAKIKDLERVHNRKDSRADVFLFPMSRWHLYSEFKSGVNTGGRIQFVWLFGIIGVFVLLLACINFMNLSTARSEKRAKEVGIRKSIGSLRGQLIGQFLSESLLMVFLALLFSLALVQFSIPWFNQVADKQVSLPWVDPFFWMAVLCFALFTGLLAGSYPAFYLSSFQPLQVLKGTFRTGRWASVPRRALVVVQFMVSVALIIGTIVVFNQIQHAKNRPVGYNREGIIQFQNNTELDPKKDVLRNDLLKTGVVEEMTTTSGPITAIWSNQIGFDWEGKDPSTTPVFGIVTSTHELGKTIGWEIKEGRDFSREFSTDTSAIILNEAGVKLTGLDNIVGKTIRQDDRPYQVVGVVKDLIMESPWKPVKPTVFFINPDWASYFVVKIKPGVPVRDALASIGEVYKKLSPGSPFDYQFADEAYDAKFRSEERIGKLARVFAILAIFISCLGLFGLSAYVAEQRTKEIGIRKVLGATVPNLWAMQSREFLVLVAVSCLLAALPTWYFLINWLADYEYRIELGWGVFALSGLLAVAVALLTVSFQSVKAALANPVKSLRSE